MISHCQGMPDMITYANRQGCETGDTVKDYPSDDDDNDESYEDSKQSEDESNTEKDSGDDLSSSSDSDSSSSANNDDDQGSDEEPEIQVGDGSKGPDHKVLRQQVLMLPMIDDAITTNQPAGNQGVGDG
jgi:hypothetical protein